MIHWAKARLMFSRIRGHGFSGLREVLNAVRYLARTGCGWRMLSKDYSRSPRLVMPPDWCRAGVRPR